MIRSPAPAALMAPTVLEPLLVHSVEELSWGPKTPGAGPLSTAVGPWPLSWFKRFSRYTVEFDGNALKSIRMSTRSAGPIRTLLTWIGAGIRLPSVAINQNGLVVGLPVPPMLPVRKNS